MERTNPNETNKDFDYNEFDNSAKRLRKDIFFVCTLSIMSIFVLARFVAFFPVIAARVVVFENEEKLERVCRDLVVNIAKTCTDGDQALVYLFNRAIICQLAIVVAFANLFVTEIAVFLNPKTPNPVIEYNLS